MTQSDKNAFLNLWRKNQVKSSSIFSTKPSFQRTNVGVLTLIEPLVICCALARISKFQWTYSALSFLATKKQTSASLKAISSYRRKRLLREDASLKILSQMAGSKLISSTTLKYSLPTKRTNLRKNKYKIRLRPAQQTLYQQKG